MSEGEVPKDLQKISTRVDELEGRQNAASLRISRVDTQLQSMPPQYRSTAAEIMGHTRYFEKVTADVLWVQSLVSAGVPADLILTAWNIKDRSLESPNNSETE